MAQKSLHTRKRKVKVNFSSSESGIIVVYLVIASEMLEKMAEVFLDAV
jgi:hypothetical protein